MNKKALGYVLFAVGLFPILLAIYMLIHGVLMYIISLLYPELARTILTGVIAIGFMGALFYGLHLIKDVKK